MIISPDVTKSSLGVNKYYIIRKIYRELNLNEFKISYKNVDTSTTYDPDIERYEEYRNKPKL